MLLRPAPCGAAGVGAQRRAPLRATASSTASVEPPLASMVAPGFERLRDSGPCRQSAKKAEKRVLRRALLLRRLKSQTRPVSSAG